MREEDLKKSLTELAEATSEEVRPGLANDIKGHIPHRLTPNKIGVDTINIMIDLRISKLATAAAIIITMIASASFFGGRDPMGEGVLQNSKLLVKYYLSGAAFAKHISLAGIPELYEDLRQEGRDVVYYGDNIDPTDSNAVLIHWKISEGKYKVVFGDSRTKTVSAEELIAIQAQMLQK